MEVERRSLLKGAAAASALFPFSGLTTTASAQPAGQKFLIKGGYVASLDPNIGELKTGDVLIDGAKIAAVGPNLSASDAMIVDAAGQLVIPGLIDTHRHTWETQLRGLIPEGDFFAYLRVILQTIAPRYRPEDVYLGNLLGSLGALDSGITTMLDWSHIMNSPQHADAAIQGLKDAGLRSVFAQGGPIGPFAEWWTPKSTNRHPDDIRRVKKQYFSSNDQLMTLAMAINGPEFSSLETTIDDIKLARDVGVPITVHIGVPGVPLGGLAKLNEAKMLGPDITYVHTLRSPDDELKLIADTGGSISTSPATEMMSGHGFASVQRWARYGLKPSISIDNETRMPTDLFTQMRALLMSDRMQEIARAGKEGGKPTIVSVRELLEFATLQGAKTLGLDSKTGSLTPGKQADIVVVNLNDINMRPSNDPVASLVLIANPRNVNWVFVDGKVKKRDGMLVDVDLVSLGKKMDESHAYLTKDVDGVK
jgi:5-methylthioadenosine/S-adenosylhomocysteine deaminase